MRTIEYCLLAAAALQAREDVDAITGCADDQIFAGVDVEVVRKVADELATPAEPGDRDRHLKALRRIKDTLPMYMGNQPKAQHYQALHAAMDAAMAALRSAEPGDALREAVAMIERLRGWCRNQQLIDEANDLVHRLATKENAKNPPRP